MASAKRLSWTVRQRQGEVLAAGRDPSPGQRRAHDLHVLLGAAERVGEPDAVPSLRHLRTGHPETQPEATAGQSVQGRGGHRRHRRGPRRDLEDPRSDADALGPRGDRGEHRRSVGAVGLRGPDHVVAETVRRHGQFHPRGQLGRARRQRQGQAQSHLSPRVISWFIVACSRGWWVAPHCGGWVAPSGGWWVAPHRGAREAPDCRGRVAPDCRGRVAPDCGCRWPRLVVRRVRRRASTRPAG